MKRSKKTKRRRERPPVSRRSLPTNFIPSTASFSLFCLPLVAFRNVVECMDIVELYELSQLSERMFSRLKHCNLKIEPIHVEFRNEMRIDIYETIHGNQRIISFGEPLKSSKNVLVFWSDPSEINMDFIEFLTEFKDLFPRVQFNVTIGNFHGFMSSWSHKLFKNCLSLMIPENVVLCASELAFVVGKTQPSRGIQIDSYMPRIIFSETILTQPFIKCRDAKWLTLTDLKTMKCEFASFDFNSITTMEVKDFIYHWMDGGNPNLQRLQLGFSDELSEIMEELGYLDWDKKKTFYGGLGEDREERIEIQRGDGVVATIFKFQNWLEFLVSDTF